MIITYSIYSFPNISASAEGHWKVARWLLEHGGAQGDKKDKTGSTAVHLAAEYNRLNVLKVLAKQ